MADDSGGHEMREWPLEGHFVVGGEGLYVKADCLGGTFASRTASYDVEIGLPQLDKSPDPIPPEIRARMGEPAVPRLDLIPPAWTFGPMNESERVEEEHLSPVWGGAMGIGVETVYPESAKDTAVIYRCRFYTTLCASDRAGFDTASEGFLSELDDWWTRFTSWVGILTGQDFFGLGGRTEGTTRAWPLFTWTSGPGGLRYLKQFRVYSTPNRLPMRALELHDLEACVIATTNDDPPPEWMFIRDARSLLSAGQQRRAIIDAEAAAELAMTTLIDNYLDDTNIADEAVRQALTKGYNNLGAKNALLKLLRPHLLPSRVQPDLIDKRNAASHGGDQITFEEAETAVEIAAQIVESAHPLASLLSGAQ